MATIRNGKLLDGMNHSGAEIMNSISASRRGVIVQSGVVKPLDPRKNYSFDEIQKIKTMPDRCKGSFGGCRSVASKTVIHDQIVDISQKLFKGVSIDYDDVGYDWMVVENYRLPANWSVRYTALMIIFPTEYPQLPPVGFYLPDSIESPNGHLYTRAYHDADETPTHNGWQWYCAYIPEGAWQPTYGKYAYNWRIGDNLWDYFTLIGEVLSGGKD